MELKSLSRKAELEGKLLLVKTELTEKMEIEYSKQFLDITGLKIGDVVQGYFSSNHGGSKTSYSTVGEYDAVLSQYENGILYLASVEPIKRSEWKGIGNKGHYYYSSQKRRTKIVSIILKD